MKRRADVAAKLSIEEGAVLVSSAPRSPRPCSWSCLEITSSTCTFPILKESMPASKSPVSEEAAVPSTWNAKGGSANAQPEPKLRQQEICMRKLEEDIRLEAEARRNMGLQSKAECYPKTPS